MISPIHWYVKQTHCWPAQWKVTFEWSGQEVGPNETSNYFRNRGDAQQEADKRNALAEKED